MQRALVQRRINKILRITWPEKNPPQKPKPQNKTEKTKIHFRLRPGSPQNCSCPHLPKLLVWGLLGILEAPQHPSYKILSSAKAGLSLSFATCIWKNLAWSFCAWKWGAAELGFLGSHVHPPPGRVEKKNWVSNSQHQGKRRGLDSNCPLPRHLVGTVMGCENSVHDLWGISGNRRGNSDDAGRKMREQSIHICFLSLFYLTSTSLVSVFTSLHV